MPMLYAATYVAGSRCRFGPSNTNEILWWPPRILAVLARMIAGDALVAWMLGLRVLEQPVAQAFLVFVQHPLDGLADPEGRREEDGRLRHVHPLGVPLPAPRRKCVDKSCGSPLPFILN